MNPESRRKDALLIEVPDEQTVLARIRAWHVAGDTLRDIATRLTAEGVPTKQGNAAWTHQSVAKIVARMEAGGYGVIGGLAIALPHSGHLPLAFPVRSYSQFKQ